MFLKALGINKGLGAKTKTGLQQERGMRQVLDVQCVMSQEPSSKEVPYDGYHHKKAEE